jgi:heme exporter protein B
MKQRVKYAFALVHQPPVLILDEPMANLDGEGVALVRRLMDDQRRSGLLIVATNDLTDVASYDLRVDLHYGSGDEPLSPDPRYEGLPKTAGVTPEAGQPRHAIDPRIAGDPLTAEDPRNGGHSRIGGQSMNAAEAATGEQEGSIEPAAAPGEQGGAKGRSRTVDAGKQQGGEARVHSRESGAGPWVRSVGAIFRKDWESELRTRYAISALLMFVVTTISIILFSLGSEGARAEVLSGMLWVVVFFSAMSGLSRTFVMEEERGTSMTLQLVARPSAVYFGKLLFNLVLVTGLDVLTVGLYALFINGFVIKTASIFILAVGLGGVGFAAASTIIAAIIARASTKGTLYPVLSFPILLPLLLTVINATRLASDGAFLEEAYGEFQILISYIVVVTAVSILVFDYVWKD